MMVLACLDGSRYTPVICDYAARAARRIGVGVELLHVIDRLPEVRTPVDYSGHMTSDMADTLLEEYAQIDEQRARALQQQARGMLDEAAERVRRAGIAAVQARLVYGNLVDQLQEHEGDARLVVIGKRGESELHATANLGSNLQRVVRASRRPIMIVPPVYRPLRHFVVAYDGGASSTKAIDMLTRETLLLEAECHLVMVCPGEAEDAARLAAAAKRLRDAGYRVTERLEKAEPGHPDEVIVSVVERTGSDLLVMGAYGHSRIRNLIIGSTTTALLRACTVPVLVVR
jgi:nucleotide-binding universal stress UspA family protein